jgi:hypothetical protein
LSAPFLKGLLVRGFYRFITAVLVLAWLAGTAAAPAIAIDRAKAADATPWRRTAEGWQRADFLAPPIPNRRPGLHPTVIASLQALLTMTAMLALSGERRKRA